MRKIILISFILLSIKSFGQIWCESGANWKYSYSSGFGTEGYVQIHYFGDTLIDNQNAKKLSKTLFAYNHINSQNINYNLGNEYTYENNGVTFIWYENNWDTLYNFNANIGDSWRMAKQPLTNACDSNSRLTVSAIGTKIINSISLKYLVVEFNYGNNVKDTIFEKIGFNGGYLFPYDQCNGYLDMNEGGLFRCYSDDNFPTYKPNYSEACDFILSLEKNIQNTELSFFPNPTKTFIEVEGEIEFDNVIYEITNIGGQKLDSGILTQKIYISSLTSGIYIMTIKNSTNTSQYRFVVE